jgi:hypothetical protein
MIICVFRHRMAGSPAFQAGCQAGAYPAGGFQEAGRWVACFLEVEHQAGVDPEVGCQAVGFLAVGQSVDGPLAGDWAAGANRVACSRAGDRPEGASSCTARLVWPAPHQDRL